MKAIITAIIVSAIITASATAGVTTLISSKQIKDGTIQLRDLSPASRAALRGSQGPRGFTGMRGIQGPRGFTGPPGIPGKSYSSYTLTSDLRKLCSGIREAEKQVDSLNSALGRYSPYWFGGDFRYSSCVYYGY